MYSTVNAGDTYFATQLYAESWTNASSTDKTKAMEMATADIDRLNFVGHRLVADQANEWPREDINNETVPDAIIKATYEQARAYLDGRDQDAEFELTRLQNQAWGSVRTGYKVGDVPVYLKAGILSIRAWRYLVPFLRSPTTLEVVISNQPNQEWIDFIPGA